MGYTIEEFSDLDPNKNTFLSQICDKVFTFNRQTTTGSPELVNTDNLQLCKQWFKSAVSHCMVVVVDTAETGLVGWMKRRLYNLKNMFSTSKDDFPTEGSYHMKVDPLQLTQQDCNQLFIDVSKDYLEFPKNCNFWQTVLIGGVGVLIMLILIYFSAFRRKAKKKPDLSTNPGINVNPDVAINVSPKKVPPKSQRLSEPKRCTRSELNLLPTVYDTPVVAIKFNKKAESECMCCLIKVEPSIDMYTPESLALEPFRTQRKSVSRKLSEFFKKDRSNRYIIETDLYDDELTESNSRNSTENVAGSTSSEKQH